MELNDKKEKLISLLSHSYSPYSHFRVAALLELKDGNLIEGVNVENISYGATICAERVAITSAIAKGYQKKDFKALYILCDSKEIGMPCFLCRQVMCEHFEKNMPVVLFSLEESKTFTVEELCPYPFESEELR